jgi:serine/threonine protein phosphatase 1
MQNNHPRIKRLPINTNGRDFIVGDIHGAYDAVFAAMEIVSFDSQVDRLFSVGDLVDRGVQSARCADFLALPYVHAVRGNHEQNLLDLYANGEPNFDTLNYMIRAYSMQWWQTTSDAERHNILFLFAKLPNVIEVETARGLVGMVHADIPKGMTWPEFTNRIEAGDYETLAASLEGRDRIKTMDCTGVQGVGRVFVGHTIQRGGAVRYGNVYAVDTGAVLNELRNEAGFALTMANMLCATQVLVETRKASLPQIVVEPDSVTNRPFSNFIQGI